MPTKLYVAKETFLTDVDGVPQTISRDITYVTGDSDLYRRFPQMFREAEPHFRGVEQATAAPGEVRQVELPSEEDPAEDDSAKKAARK